MAVPSLEMPTFFIYRDTGSVDQGAHLVFFPPKDSDELFDALREAFPRLKSHSERMRQASIEFLIREQTQSLATPSFSQETIPTSASPSWSASFPSMTSANTPWSSPDAFESFNSSPQIQSLNRQISNATSVATPSEASPSGLEQMTSVFSLCDSAQPKQRIRRKMTEQEKVDYRQRRIVKACEKCAKRKRKCTHNSPDPETVTTKAKKTVRHDAAKLSKAVSAPDQLPGLQDPLLTDTLPIDFFPNNDEFGDLLDFGLPEETLPSSQMQWPWTDTPDFTLMGLGDYDHPNASWSTPDESWISQDSIATSSAGSTSEANVSPSVGNDVGSATGGEWNRTIWEHLRTGQQVGQRPLPPDSDSLYPNDDVARPPVDSAHHTSTARFSTWDWTGTLDSAHIVDLQHVRQEESADAALLEHGNSRGDGRQTTHSSELEAWVKNAMVGLAQQQVEADQVQSGPTLTSHKGVGIDSSGLPGDSSTALHANAGRNKVPPIKSSSGSSGDELISTESIALNATSDDILANANLSTKMFMLRRRITEPPRSLVRSSSTTPLLQTIATNCSQTSPLLQTLAETSQQVMPVLQMSTTATNDVAAVDVSTKLAQTGPLDPHEERLSDHFRQKDHFGRSFSAGLQFFLAIASLACLLWTLSSTTFTCLSTLSMVVLASIAPVSTGSASASKQTALLQRTMRGRLTSLGRIGRGACALIASEAACFDSAVA